MTWGAITGGGSLVGGTELTDGSGIATLGGWTLGPAAGVNTISAASDGLNSVTFMATATDQASGDYTVITRDDGAKQWAVKGKPVYFWAKDAKPGDKTGDGVNKVWQTAKP